MWTLSTEKVFAQSIPMIALGIEPKMMLGYERQKKKKKKQQQQTKQNK